MPEHTNDGRQKHQRLMFCLRRGLPLPGGRSHSPPVDGPIPATTDPWALEQVRGQIASLQAGSFTTYAQLPESRDAGAFVPSGTGTWQELTEMGKLAVLDFWVDWSGVSLRDRDVELSLHVNVSQLPSEVQQLMPDMACEQAGKLSLGELKEMATEKPGEPEHRKDRGKGKER